MTWNNRQPWTDEDDSVIVARVAEGCEVIAPLIGRTAASVRVRMTQLGVRKTTNHLSAETKLALFIVKDPETGCHVWQGYRDRHGYVWFAAKAIDALYEQQAKSLSMPIRFSPMRTSRWTRK